MEVTGKIILALDEVTGVSKAGNNWKKREYVLETQESYPKKIFFDFFGDRADQYPLSVGDEIKLSFDIESREYMGRWYTSVRGWKAEPFNEAMANAAAPVNAASMGGDPLAAATVPPVGQQITQSAVPVPPVVGGADDDLPF